MDQQKLLNQFRQLICLCAVLLSTGTLLAQANFTISQVQQILREQDQLHLSPADYADIKISAQYFDAHTGVTHVYAQQHHQGLPLKDGTLGLHFGTDGTLVYLTSNFLTNIAEKVNTASPSVRPETALETALARVGIDATRLTLTEQSSMAERVYAKDNYSVYDMPVRLVYETDDRGKLTLAWEARIYPLDEQNYWVVSIDANTGREIARTDLVVHCSFEGPDHTHGTDCAAEGEAHTDHTAAIAAAVTGTETSMEVFPPSTNFYRVFDAPVEAPTFGGRTLVGASGDAASSPLGWHDDGTLEYNITRGNNVFAYHDPGPGSTPLPAIGGTPGQQPLVFDFEADLSLTPVNYRDAAITNLFYWNNKIHDIFYQYGFTEAAGNFQWSNFANGGEGMDAVLAEAQDGSGVNNANFLTLADGLPGRMQMFLWTSVPIIDGDFDNGVILHEYGHGISTRLTGGPAATCLGGDEQGGEGWSDYFGLMVTGDPNNVAAGFTNGRGIGTYVLGEGPGGDGIRPARYSTDFGVNDYTYGDLTRAGISAPHGVGFIWCTMLWEMTANLVDAYGYDPDVTYGNGGNNLALDLVMLGLKLQPCSPTFVEQRDAILAADQILTGGTNKCLIWEAFAKRGLGFSASSGTNARGDEIPAFDMPPSFCQPTVTMETQVASLTNNGGTLPVMIKVTNNASSPISGITVTETMPTGMSLQSSTHPTSVNGQTVKINNLTVPANTTTTIQLNLSVNTASTATMQHRDDMEANPFGWTASPGLDQFVWSAGNAFSGNYAWFAADPNNFGNQLLTWNQQITVGSETHLRFVHSFNTEANFDGGLVEVSNDGGTTWTDIGPLFVQNGYNNLVAAADNPLINGFCFAGNSGGYIHSLADLSPYAGQTVQVRFRLASDVLTAAEGWYIDDMEVVNEPFLVHNQASFSMANGFVTGSATDEVLVLNAPLQTIQQGSVPTPQLAQTTLAEGLNVSLSPNPARDVVDLQLVSTQVAPVQVRILNGQGQTMYLRSELPMDGQQSLTINVNDWPAGLYFTQVVQGDQQLTQKLIIK